MDKSNPVTEPTTKASPNAEANQCIALGVGVGALGTAAAITLGVTCPICFIAAPALVGVGLVRRIKNGLGNKKE